MKRERREQAEYAASLTTCEGTWLEKAPDAAELQRIDVASKALREQRRLAIEFHQDPSAANIFSIELFRNEVFAPMHMEDWLVEQMIDAHGEPPVVDEGNENEFADYLRNAVLYIATSRVRGAMASQLKRYLPQFVDAGQWKEAVAIDYNAFRTTFGNEVSPFLVQMALAGFARYYDEHDDEPQSE
ncbi:MAG: hypothetical protein MUD01_16385 [Chloroflexaceae bacterium]|jgi:hypothetical protein|nr:hypothetical protein [Chloroflexaceae bacterium]